MATGKQTDEKVLYTQLYSEIRQILFAARKSVRQAVNTEMITTYWEIGRLIVEDEQKGEKYAEYGKEVLQTLSKRLTEEFGRGLSIRNLRNMRLFYSRLQNRQSVTADLSWTHYTLLLRVEDDKAFQWYMNEAVEQQWSTRQLGRQISTLYYERLLASQDEQPVEEEANEKLQRLRAQDVLHDPYVLDFLDLPAHASLRESDLESGLIENLQHFLLELGKGFSFVARQKHVRIGDEDFFVDLVFYNYLLKCFVLIDLKLGKLTHQDVGQMDSYVRIYEEHLKVEGDNPTIGLILCSEKNEAIARYSVLHESQQLFASRYKLYLPSEDELRQELERERFQIEQHLREREDLGE